MPLIDLQAQFIGAVVRCIEVEWDRVEIHYEFHLDDGTALEQSTSVTLLGGARTDLDLPFDVLELMRAMRDATPEGQAEQWSSMDFWLDSTGTLGFDYGYGIPPMAARTLAAWERRVVAGEDDA